MKFDDVIMFMIAGCFVLGCLDRCIGNRFFLGNALEEGFSYMPLVALAAIGMMCIAPVLAKILQPIVVPVYSFFGVDAAMFSPTFFAMDTIAALICAPIGCFIGGMVYGIVPLKMLINLIPIGMFAIIVAVGTFLSFKITIKIFNILARIISAVICIGLAAASFKCLTGIELIDGLEDISVGFFTVGKITITLGGSFCLLAIIKKILKKPIKKFAVILKIDETTMSGLVISVITATPAFAMMKDMNVKGKVIIAAFAGTSAYLLGACLGYVSTVNSEMILPMFVTKIVAGILAVPLGMIMVKKLG